MEDDSKIMISDFGLSRMEDAGTMVSSGSSSGSSTQKRSHDLDQTSSISLTEMINAYRAPSVNRLRNPRIRGTRGAGSSTVSNRFMPNEEFARPTFARIKV